MRWMRSGVGLCSCVILGCAVPHAGRPIDVPSYRSALLPAPVEAPPDGTPDLALQVLAGAELTVDGAVAVALARRPDLAVAEAQIDVETAARIGALTYPNPEASLTVVRDGADSPVPQLWLEVSQPIVLSDRRRLGAETADANAVAATWELFQRRVEAVAEVREAYLEASAAGAAITLARDELVLAEDFRRVAEIRVAAEAVPELELLRARAGMERAQFAVEAAEVELAARTARLAAVMGVPDAVLPPCPALDPEPPALPDAASLEARAVEESFAVRAAQARVRAAELAADAARAQGVPDLTVFAGYGQSIDPTASLWTVGLGVPLPLFDRNEGAVAEANAQRVRAEAEVLAAEAEVRADLRIALAEYVGATASLRSIRDTVAPLADQALAGAEAGYREGGADYLVLLDARRAGVEARALELQALLEAWLAVARIESLVGPVGRETASPHAGPEVP
ncbi:MAG: TolC family protein [Deltaproteobacteria bacterium]|nr:TolC family protein [Deltaproteobacteria bacterium]